MAGQPPHQGVGRDHALQYNCSGKRRTPARGEEPLEILPRSHPDGALHCLESVEREADTGDLDCRQVEWLPAEKRRGLHWAPEFALDEDPSGREDQGN